jgi:hypothetical protein
MTGLDLGVMCIQLAELQVRVGVGVVGVGVGVRVCVCVCVFVCVCVCVSAHLLDSRSAPHATIMSTPASSAARAVHSSNAVTSTALRVPLSAIRSAAVSFLFLGFPGTTPGID